MLANEKIPAGRNEARYAQLAQLFLSNLDENDTLKLTKAQQLMLINGFGSWREALEEGERYAGMNQWAGEKLTDWFTVCCDGQEWYLRKKEG